MDNSLGAILENALHVYINSTRQTGRTTRMIETLKDGDVVVCLNSTHARLLERRIFEDGKKVKCVAVAPNRIDEMVSTLRGMSGTVVFEHTWIEKYYQYNLECASQHLLQLHKAINPEKPKCDVSWIYTGSMWVCTEEWK